MNTDTESVILIAPEKAHISKLNTRQPKPADVAELVVTIRESGQITPAIVRPHPTKKGEYEIAAGARRSVACKVLKRPLRAIVRDIPDGDFEDMILTDNLQRVDPDPMQEAALIQRRLKAGMEPSEIAARYGKDETWLKRRLKLASLTHAARDAWGEEGAFAHFSIAMMEFVGTLPPEEQDNLADNPWETRDYGSLKDLIESVKRRDLDLSKVDWLEDPASFIEGCGPGCVTDTSKGLFHDPAAPCGHCTNEKCFFAREAKLRDSRITDLIGDKPISDYRLVRTAGYTSRIEAFGQSHDILPDWQTKERYIVAKKPSPGSVPALDFKDPNHPKLVHLTSKGKQPLHKGAESKAKETREERLTGKRLAEINKRLQAHAKKAPIPAHIPMLNLAAAFGTSDSRRECSIERQHRDAWDSVHAADGIVSHLGYGKPEPASREEVLWESIRRNITSRLTFRIPKDLLPDFKRSEMRQIAALTSFPWEEQWKEICRSVVPVPKSWGPGIDPITLQPTAERIKEVRDRSKKQAAKTKAA